MSTAQINPQTPAPAPAAGLPDADIADNDDSNFQGKPAAVVSSASQENRPGTDAAAPSHSAWKRGEAKADPNLSRVIDMAVEGAKQEQAKLNSSNARPRSQSLLRSLINMLLKLFRRAPTPPAAPAAGNQANAALQLSDLTERALIKSPQAGMLYQQIESLQSSIAKVPDVKTMLQTASRDDLNYEFTLAGENFRRLTTAATSAKMIAAIPDAGRTAIEAGQPDLSEAKQQKLARRIDLGVRIIDRLSATKYVPENESLQGVIPNATFRSFGDTGTNPYGKLVKEAAFGEVEENHLRDALIDASVLLEQAGKLVIDSAKGKDSQIDPDRLSEMAGRFGIDEQISKDQVQFSTPI